jgi:hypothetical protein
MFDSEVNVHVLTQAEKWKLLASYVALKVHYLFAHLSIITSKNIRDIFVKCQSTCIVV